MKIGIHITIQHMNERRLKNYVDFTCFETSVALSVPISKLFVSFIILFSDPVFFFFAPQVILLQF